MKTRFSFLLLILLISSLSLNAQRDKEKIKVVADSTVADSTEYELVVLDPGFESWLITKQKMAYSDSYYRSKILIYVSEWNSRYMNPLKYGNMYESYIDYRPEINYGLDFNFRLYYYFKYFEEVNRVSLFPGSNVH